MLFIISLMAVTVACQSATDARSAQPPAPIGTPGVGLTPDPNSTHAQTPDPDDTAGSFAGGEGVAGSLSGHDTTYQYVDEVTYWAGNYARSRVIIEDDKGDYFNLKITFTAETGDAVMRKCGKYGQYRGCKKEDYKYPIFRITLPLNSYQENKHSNADMYFRDGSPYQSGGELRVELKRMNTKNSFHLKFKVLKSALTSGQLSNSFNLQFERPQSGVTQFINRDNNDTPREGSFPRE